MRLGIDFGTTRTVVAVADRGNFPVIGFETANGDIVEHFPSVVATDGEELRFGHAAVAVLNEPGWTALRSFKRLLARPGQRNIVQIGALEMSLGQLLADFLRALKLAIVTSSNSPVPLTDDEPLDAVIAVPARASSAQRFLTIEAFREAGFTVVGVVNEPSAAGIEYANRYAKTFSSARQHVLVYDLGGGTFDLSLVEMTNGRHSVLAHAGLNDLGGDDFDAALLHLVAPHAPFSTQALEVCRAAKEALTPNSRKLVVELADGVHSVSVDAYYEALKPLLDRSLALLATVLPDEAVAAGVAGVYVVGGGSDLPIVARTLRDTFGRRVKSSPYSSGAIAVGLAIAAADQAPTLQDKLSRTFGVFRERGAGSDVTFDAILNPQTTTVDGKAVLVRRYRPVHNLGHFRFAECDTVTATGVPNGDIVPLAPLIVAFDPTLRGAKDLSEVPVQRLSRRLPVIEERYHVEDAGIRVVITDLESGWSHEHRISAAVNANA